MHNVVRVHETGHNPAYWVRAVTNDPTGPDDTVVVATRSLQDAVFGCVMEWMLAFDFGRYPMFDNIAYKPIDSHVSPRDENRYFSENFNACAEYVRSGRFIISDYEQRLRSYIYNRQTFEGCAYVTERPDGSVALRPAIEDPHRGCTDRYLSNHYGAAVYLACGLILDRFGFSWMDFTPILETPTVAAPHTPAA